MLNLEFCQMAKDKTIRVEKPEGLGFWATKHEFIFEDDNALREMYGLVGTLLREATGKLGGRPRDPKKERCPCGAMTAKRAAARGHVCLAELEPAASKSADKQTTDNKPQAMTQKQALTEARRRWGKSAFASHDPEEEKPYQVGYVKPGFQFVLGSGNSWEEALAQADKLSKH